jgi:hypothetical protein
VYKSQVWEWVKSIDYEKQMVFQVPDEQ